MSEFDCTFFDIPVTKRTVEESNIISCSFFSAISNRNTEDQKQQLSNNNEIKETSEAMVSIR